MRRLCLIYAAAMAAAAIMLTRSAAGQDDYDATFAWDAPTGGVAITGYRLEVTSSNAPVRQAWTAGHPGATVTGLVSGVSYSARVYARNGELESAPSEPLVFARPGRPGKPRVSVTVKVDLEVR